MSQPDPEQDKAKRRGRPEAPLVIEGDWEDAVKSALRKPPPPGKAPTGKPPKGPGTRKPPAEE